MAVFLTILVPALKDVSHILLVGRKEEQMRLKGLRDRSMELTSTQHLAGIMQTYTLCPYVLWIKLCCLRNFYAEFLIPNVTTSADRA